MDNKSLYRSLYRIRRFEETVLEEFARGRFYGTTHTYLGQEANAVGVLSRLEPGDVVVSNHRSHGHFLAYGGDMCALFAELMGRATGVCGGRGGSQHLCWHDFYSNGILAGTLPMATGMALAEKLRGSGKIVIAFLGDGAMGEGVLYEALNMASLWKAPILYVVENNRIAQTTAIELNLAGDIASRFSAFGIPHQQMDSSDVLEIQTIAEEKIEGTRSQGSPQALILNTHRFGPHSKGDDTRNPHEIDRLRREHDPIQIHGVRLSKEERSAIEAEVEAEVDRAFQQALQDPLPSLEESVVLSSQSPSAKPKS
jgi:TPP-dependent pyruvate/acetoin dehydrogenase alpha subunit